MKQLVVYYLPPFFFIIQDHGDELWEVCFHQGDETVGKWTEETQISLQILIVTEDVSPTIVHSWGEKEFSLVWD